MKNLDPLASIILMLCGLAGFNYLPEIALPHFEISFIAVVGALGLLAFLLVDKKDELYGFNLFYQVLLMYLVTILGIFYLGGPSFTWNPGLLILTSCLTGILAAPPLAVLGLGYMWAVFLALSLNQDHFFLPGTRMLSQSYAFSDLLYPLTSATLLGALTILLNQARVKGFKQGREDLKRKLAKALNKERGLEKTKGNLEHRQVSEVPEPDKSGGVEKDKFFTREYLEQQEAQTQATMQSILDTVVYFMSRNFKSYSAMGFLASGDGNRFYMNSSVSKSRYLDRDIIIIRKKGMLGKAAGRVGGFTSGDLKSYPESLEYYTEEENINSLMVMPVKDSESGKVIGLLVVDSDRIRAFNDDHKELLDRFTQIASAMIANARMTDQLNKQSKWADTLYEISKMLSKVLKVEDVMAIIGDSLAKIFIQDRVIICIYNAKKKKGQIWNIIGNTDGLKRGQEFDIKNPNSIYGHAFSKRRELIIHKYRAGMKQYVRFDEPGVPERRPQEIMIIPLYDDRNAVLAVIGVESNQKGTYSESEMRMLITLMANFSTSVAKAKLYGELEKLATIDGLTQIANHRKFQEVLTDEMYRSQRYKDQVTLLLMDIDHFKKFNDTYGHPVGDEVLRKVAKTLQKACRTTDLCARYGGEEFTVVMISSGEKDSRFLAERIRKGIEAMEVPHEGKTLKVTVSIGSATFPQDVTTKQELIDNADRAMYHSKESGRNQVSYFSDLRNKE